MDKVNMRKNKNRRDSFRIYDEVNLSYKKIDEKWAADHQPILNNISNDHSFSTDIKREVQDSTLLLPSLEDNLPDSQFKEHESHNVNISASGMAFNCEDTLKEGDILIIKIQLASSMAVIVTYSQVVYCKDIQPDGSPNDSPHPCFIGAHFVNMKDEDRELLAKHVDKKRKLHNWVNGAILAAVIIVLAIPDVVFGLLVEFVHFLFELFLHILHLSFEFIELNLDHLIEHFFETDLHQTQVIVFYVILSFIVYGLYRLWRSVPPFCRRFKQNLFRAYQFKKASVLFFWREQPLFNKIKIVVIGIAAIAGYFFFGM
jgi:hypothetical protein